MTPQTEQQYRLVELSGDGRAPASVVLESPHQTRLYLTRDVRNSDLLAAGVTLDRQRFAVWTA